MTLPLVFNIDKNIIHIHYNKDIKIFDQDLIDITVEACWYIG